jgi:hypothetical protein
MPSQPSATACLSPVYYDASAVALVCGSPRVPAHNSRRLSPSPVALLEAEAKHELTDVPASLVFHAKLPQAGAGLRDPPGHAVARRKLYELP